ncbi:hypothetical protein Lepto7375DRAFT_6981 [Leptolyngbya sp. PCC 7375]|nr:hypothetical protein Lepto7375DRAFT_6981 [Leptolyngbya sp. PCC 7375]
MEVNDFQKATVEYFQRNTIVLETAEGSKAARISARSPLFSPPNQTEKIVEFRIPKGYVRLGFESEIISTSPFGAQPRAEWVDENNPKDGRIRLYAIAYPITQTGGVTTEARVTVSNVIGIKEEAS